MPVLNAIRANTHTHICIQTAHLLHLQLNDFVGHNARAVKALNNVVYAFLQRKCLSLFIAGVFGEAPSDPAIVLHMLHEYMRIIGIPETLAFIIVCVLSLRFLLGKLLKHYRNYLLRFNETK